METQQLILSPDNIPVLSKQNAASFHQMAKSRIFDTGEGLFEYIETIKFFAALDKQIAGDTQAKIEPDKEFLNYVREQIEKNGQKAGTTFKFTSLRGVKFENADTGTTYDFSKCNDSVLVQLEDDVAKAKEALKQRQEFLKTVSHKGLDIRDDDELVTIYPPSKSSKSSFKVSLPK